MPLCPNCKAFVRARRGKEFERLFLCAFSYFDEEITITIQNALARFFIFYKATQNFT
jgi:hypothetical protein